MIQSSSRGPFVGAGASAAEGAISESLSSEYPETCSQQGSNAWLSIVAHLNCQAQKPTQSFEIDFSVKIARHFGHGQQGQQP